MAYFNKVLVANRGEIARRIIRTCQQLNIETVAVYSEADAQAPFVSEATEAVCIGPAQAKKSYLDIEKIIQAAKETGADAIHPGYGFLSENPVFAGRCEQENIVFIGPSAKVMETMGSKLEAREQMKKAGVPVVPGSVGRLSSIEEALAVAEELGYPLMLKASAGGGGIGMQLVHSREELQKAFDSTIQKAESFFNDGAVFLEKWISHPRHIEVQVAADRFGNIVHLFERECSVQRRNQKVVEESPSPFLDEALREQLLAAAVRGVKEIGYTNVGTMEFIFDEHKNFYFLEMNTRLQVEHPVTEEITGLDLVEWQLRIAAGEELPLQQHEIHKSGHAIECRLYAEDPNTFFPSPGHLTKLTLPQKEVRLDFGVQEGNDVTPFYDPMIGKIIVHGTSRDEAIKKMERALAQMDVQGLKTNLTLLEDIMKNDEFISGDYTTQFLEKKKVQLER
ncbi:acetyl-CoA carboxylase biotin carboxylase subunit [Bacillus thermotolerans]|uniref:acetyl-CoA carboxylase biotin carboxylase subunit n=1 Tax=Bacillus thermotolerans TaxID=1221996 RepID=UPI0005800762|nr:acetyl-CoA carboxylase biotin carboxylase subunit [Bacillus thermotolerans]KKB36900.1 Biotin carboxylase of methylcrotonyl-CoA carboxylase [Bacillus thermotolerans]